MADKTTQTRTLRDYANDFMAFAADLHVPIGGASGRLGDSWAEFQQRDFEVLAPSLEALAKGAMPPRRRYWLERTKGASKDSDVAVAVLWLIAFSRRAIRVQVGAYDQQQASEHLLIDRAILDIDAPLNRMLRQVVDVQRNRVVAHAGSSSQPESIVEVLTTDAYGSHGARPDLVIANELSHVASEAFMQTLFDNADKVPRSLVVVASNAGEVGTWQEKWRDIAVGSPRWHVSVRNTPAPWISPEDLAESELRNPPSRFARLWRGVWSTGEGDGLSLADIRTCTTTIGPHDRPRPGWFYLSALDLGLKHDHSALVVLAIDPVRQMVEVAQVESWRPQDFATREIDLQEVENAVVKAHLQFGVSMTLADPWQAALMIQRLREKGLHVGEWVMSPKGKDVMARALLEAFRNRLVNLYPDADFERDLLRLRIKEGSFGYKLDAIKDEQGHADRAVAFAIGLPLAMEWARNGVSMEPVPERMRA